MNKLQKKVLSESRRIISEFDTYPTYREISNKCIHLQLDEHKAMILDAYQTNIAKQKKKLDDVLGWLDAILDDSDNKD